MKKLFTSPSPSGRDLGRGLTLALCLLIAALSTHAQTLVNRAWKTTTGNPTLTYNHLAGARGSNYVVTAGNTYRPGQAENFLVTRYSNTGDIVWQTEYDAGNSNADGAFDNLTHLSFGPLPSPKEMEERIKEV